MTPAPSVKRLNETLSAPGRLTPASQIGSAAPSPAPRTGPGPGQSGGSRTSGNGQSGAKEKRGKVSVTLPRDLGSLELRKVPDDNSCLFSAIAVVFEGGIEGAGGLRKVVVDAIRKDPETYSEVMLGYVLFSSLLISSHSHTPFTIMSPRTVWTWTVDGDGDADDLKGNQWKNTFKPSRNLIPGVALSNYQYFQHTTKLKYHHSTSNLPVLIDSVNPKDFKIVVY